MRPVIKCGCSMNGNSSFTFYRNLCKKKKIIKKKEDSLDWSSLGNNCLLKHIIAGNIEGRSDGKKTKKR
jgi:hypothetical protein